MGLIDRAYRFLTSPVFGAGANMQSKVGGGAQFNYLRLKGNAALITSKWRDTETAQWNGTNGVSCNLVSRTLTVDGGDWATASGTIQRATAAKTVSELAQGTDGQVLTVDIDAGDGGGLAWAANTDTNNYLNSLSFNTSDGILTAGREGLVDLTADIDNRYPTYDAGATNYVTYWANANKVTGTSGLQYDTSTFTVAGGHITSIVQVLTDPGGSIYRMGPSDYHVHITNEINPGIDQPITLPAISIGRVVLLSTSGSTPGGGGTNTITLAASGSDTINTLLTSTVLSTNGNNNYDTFRFVAETATNWIGAKMEAVS